MPRNSSGNYSLPGQGTLNPVISGSTISTTWANTTLNDIATALTDSLDRHGEGAMLAPLHLVDGTDAAPALSFETEHPTGLYRAGSHDIRFAVNGVDTQQWTADFVALAAAPVTISTPLGVGLTVTSGAGTEVGVVATGSGAGTGVFGQGGPTSGWGVSGTGGAPDGAGMVGFGAGTGQGVAGTGGATGGAGVFGTGGASDGAGVVGQGGATNGHGVLGTGAGSGSGVRGLAGSAAGVGVTGVGSGTGPGVAGLGGASSGLGGSFGGGAPNGSGVNCVGQGSGFAAIIGAGHAHFTGGNPSATTGFTNVQTPANIPKAWVKGTLNQTTSPVLNAGFNVASVACSTTDITVTFAAALAADHCPIITLGGVPAIPTIGSTSTTTVVFEMANPLGGVVDPTSVLATGSTFYVTVMGLQ